MEEWAYIMTTLALFLIGFFGFTLNLLVIVLMCKDIQVSDNFTKTVIRAVCFVVNHAHYVFLGVSLLDISNVNFNLVLSFSISFYP
jgi:hypothetical protein